MSHNTMDLTQGYCTLMVARFLRQRIKAESST